MKIPHDAVEAAMREAAARLIMPRFGALASGEIEEKKADDFVTIADRESELFLAPRLAELLPGSLVVGEEAVHGDPTLLDRLAGDDLVWLIDPVDGTRNFIHRNPHFAVIVALVRGGRTLAGWMHAPALGRELRVEAGAGARVTGLAEPEPVLPGIAGPLGEFPGRLHDGTRARDRAAAAGFAVRKFRGSCVFAFMDFAVGRIDAMYMNKGWPWDHAAGVLAARESGALARYLRDGSEYTPRRWNMPFVITRGEELCTKLRAALA
jgi:fructose-1,6-bisphosphatase/inositol monophosphatase family enzyme